MDILPPPKKDNHSSWTQKIHVSAKLTLTSATLGPSEGCPSKAQDCGNTSVKAWWGWFTWHNLEINLLLERLFNSEYHSTAVHRLVKCTLSISSFWWRVRINLLHATKKWIKNSGARGFTFLNPEICCSDKLERNIYRDGIAHMNRSDRTGRVNSQDSQSICTNEVDSFYNLSKGGMHTFLWYLRGIHIWCPMNCNVHYNGIYYILKALKVKKVCSLLSQNSMATRVLSNWVFAHNMSKKPGVHYPCSKRKRTTG
jgi:hypothetical protein